MPADPGARRFRAFGVGLPKTGTTSLSSLFGAYRTGHEHMVHEADAAIADRLEGRSSEEDLVAFIRLRDARGGLEMDVAGFHHFWIDRLVREFPDARFVWTLRDARSWLDSLLRYLLDDGPRGGAFVGFGRRALGLPFDLPHRDRASRAQLWASLPDHLEPMLRFWRLGNAAIARAVPRERLLVVPTARISDRIAVLAAHVGVEPEALRAERSHELAAADRGSVLERLEPGRVQGAFDALPPGLRGPIDPVGDVDALQNLFGRASSDGPTGSLFDEISAW